ncbi:MAG: hypothetical protein H3C37_00950 [Candidatus Kapabacteria bacterium]|nr:MAG: hypothetical protein UZ22_OP11002000853 [Microgenomates bacterium OLB23]MBW7852802.1 hypothetical protein [Candidatus Kapabacteria bacterium]
MKQSIGTRIDRLELGDGRVRQVFIIEYEDPVTGELKIETTDSNGNCIVVTGEEARALQIQLDSDPYTFKICD